MTDPNDNDDTWGDLARELGLDEPNTPHSTPHDEQAEPIAEDIGEFEDAGLIQAEPGMVDTDSDDAEGESEGESGEISGEEEPQGPGRKRRRRRRRRKKGGSVGQAAEPGEAIEELPTPETEAPDEDEATASYGTTRRDDTDADDEAEEIEPAAVALAAEEDTGSEVLRELIATWNVPSWDDIVGGLYRPER